jgi:hypothetical protein
MNCEISEGDFCGWRKLWMEKIPSKKKRIKAIQEPHAVRFNPMKRAHKAKSPRRRKINP